MSDVDSLAFVTNRSSSLPKELTSQSHSDLFSWPFPYHYSGRNLSTKWRPLLDFLPILKLRRSFGGTYPIRLIEPLNNPIPIDWSVTKQIMDNSWIITNPSFPNAVIVDDGVDGVEIDYLLTRLLGANCKKEINKSDKITETRKISKY